MNLNVRNTELIKSVAVISKSVFLLHVKEASAMNATPQRLISPNKEFQALVNKTIESPMPVRTLLPRTEAPPNAQPTASNVSSPVTPTSKAVDTRGSHQSTSNGSILTNWAPKCLPGKRVVVEG